MALVTGFTARRWINGYCHASAVVNSDGVKYVLDDGQLFGGPPLIMTFDTFAGYMRKRQGTRYGIFDVEILDRTQP